MKEEKIKELFEQFEAIAKNIKAQSAGVQENLHKYWVIPNGKDLKESQNEQKTLALMLEKRLNIIFLALGK